MRSRSFGSGFFIFVRPAAARFIQHFTYNNVIIGLPDILSVSEKST